VELKTVLVRSEKQRSEPVDQELVILNLARNHYISLDEIGRRIWELLETQRSVEDLCRQLSQEFDATAEQISADVLPSLKELESEGLVSVVA
jgi:hypothetical protein